MRLWPTRTRTTAVFPDSPLPKNLSEWAALSMATNHTRPTGEPIIDSWNDAVICVQSYLNGKAIAARTDAETEYLLRLRAELNDFHVTPTEAT